MIVVGDRFRRKSDGSLWEVAAFIEETVRPGERAVRKAALGRLYGFSSPETIPLEDLDNEVGWEREGI